MAFSLTTNQHAYATGAASATIVVVLPNNPTAGNVVVVSGLYQDALGPFSITSILDSNGNAYTVPTNGTESSQMGVYGAVYEAYLLVAPANATKTITVTFGASGAFVSAFAAEFTVGSGPAVFNSAPAAATGTGTTINSPTVTQNGNGDLLIGAMVTAHSVTAANNGWVSTETLATTYGDCLGYVLSSSGNKALDFTVNISGGWSAVGMSFKETPGAGRTTKNTRAWPLGTEVGMGLRMDL